MKSLLLSLLVLSSAVQAESVYVIDRLLIGVHEKADQSSTVVGVIPSGTALEILERQGDWARVSGPNSLQGWVDAGYVAPERPAKLVVDELENRIQALQEQLQQPGGEPGSPAAEPVTVPSSTLQAKLDEVRQELASERLKVAEFKARQIQIREQDQHIESLQQKLQQQQQTSNALQKRLDQANAKQIRRIDDIDFLAVLRHRYTQIAAAALLLLGLIAGIWFMDWRNRRRHGGFRI